MKIVYAVLLLSLAACTNADKKDAVKMPGAYTMTTARWKTAKTDTTTTIAQLKIYNGDHVMYANINTPDSISSWGIGTWAQSGDTVTENMFYTANDTSKYDKPASYNLMITKTDKGYSQFIHNIGVMNGDSMDLTETYDHTGSGATSGLDGAWKETKRLEIKGKDTTDVTTLQYKMYGDGGVIWAHTWSDSTGKSHAGIGFGTFTLSGTKLKETLKASTYSSVRGQSFDIEITMDGKDGFTQTMKSPDGTVSVETYTRLKK